MTRRAERSLVEIARCTVIAAGEAPSQDCRSLIDPDLPKDLCCTRAGQHVIEFVEMPDQVIVVDVLHGRSDPPRRLAALDAPEDFERHLRWPAPRVSPRGRHPDGGVNLPPLSRG